MILVSAMAIQNAVHRVHLASAPPTTLMTGTTTQIMIDLADLLHGVPSETKGVVRARVLRISASVGSFAAGCAAAALLYGVVHTWCFLLPPAFALCSLFMAKEGPAKASPG